MSNLGKNEKAALDRYFGTDGYHQIEVGHMIGGKDVFLHCGQVRERDKIRTRLTTDHFRHFRRGDKPDDSTDTIPKKS